MINPLKPVENFLYLVRDSFWNYPDIVWGGEGSLYARFGRTYKLTRPYSHFATAIVVTIIVGLLSLNSERILFAQKPQQLIEGVVIGVDESGVLQTLSKVNPLLPSAIQLEKDLSELIYEPLIRFETDNTVTPVLANQIIRIEEGADYEFVLRTNVSWHDGRRFGVEDVIATLQVVSELNQTNSMVQAVKQMAWERTGENSIRICTTTPAIQEQLGNDVHKCSGIRDDKPILANFLELIQIKVMPAHKIGSLNSLNITTPEPEINRFPIGTGPYRFEGATDRSIYLNLHQDYYLSRPQIRRIEFRLFASEESAVIALQNGEIHTLSTASTENVRSIASYPQLSVNKSPVQITQYWAIYFNLRKDLDDKPLGPPFFQDVEIRRAIAAATDRARIIQTLLDVGTEAKGPIHESSFFYNDDAGWETYDVTRANKKLDDSGWVANPVSGIREKGGQRLSFKLSYTDNFDRNKVVESIRLDLEQVGIELIPDPRSLKELTEEVVTPKLFDALLFGMSTFVDPDRYELFHSEEALNLASYEGSVETVKIENRETVRLPKVDRLLEQARSFNPFAARSTRKETYDEFQQLVAEDAPVVFLYHPQFLYYSNKRVQNLDLRDVINLEQRFRNIDAWIIEN